MKSYKVLIAPKLKDEIRAYGLPRRILIEVLNRLNSDLRTDPKKCFDQQVVPYADMFTYPFVIEGFSFTFFVRLDKENMVLGVVGCHFLPPYDNPLGGLD